MWNDLAAATMVIIGGLVVVPLLWIALFQFGFGIELKSFWGFYLTFVAVGVASAATTALAKTLKR
jgi:hypothetical protein